MNSKIAYVVLALIISAECATITLNFIITAPAGTVNAGGQPIVNAHVSKTFVVGGEVDFKTAIPFGVYSGKFGCATLFSGLIKELNVSPGDFNAVGWVIVVQNGTYHHAGRIIHLEDIVVVPDAISDAVAGDKIARVDSVDPGFDLVKPDSSVDISHYNLYVFVAWKNKTLPTH